MNRNERMRQQCERQVASEVPDGAAGRDDVRAGIGHPRAGVGGNWGA
ncbi:MAG: hypothetical protein OXH68_21165 [Gammaproteobacteria bacterium]|nr:hypothetical protein [Gammaproteobacteria bacterium]